MNHTYNRKNRSVRLLCLLLAMAMLLPALDGLAESLSSKYMYTTMNNVMLRPKPGTSDYIDRLSLGWPLEKLQELTVGAETWYQVKAKSTPTFPNRESTGYVRSNVVRMMSAAEETAYLAGSPYPSSEGGTGSGTGGTLSNIAVVNVTTEWLLQTPNGVRLVALLSGARMTILETPADTVNGWYKVTASGYTGYIKAASIRVLTTAEAAGGTPSDPATQSGYVKLTKANVNLRRTPGGESQTQIPIGTILPFYGAPTTRAGYQWVYVLYNGIRGYVRSDCYTFTDAAGNAVTGPTPAPVTPPIGGTEAPVVSGSGSIRLTKGGVNLRKTPGGVSLMQMTRGLVLPYKGKPTTYGGYQWVNAQHPSTGTWGYVRSDCYEFVTGGGTAPVTPPSGTTGYIVTTIGSLNVRTSPSLTATTFTQLPKSGVTFPYYGLVTGGGRQWYRISYNGRSAYILAIYAKVTTAPSTGAPAVPTPTINPADLSSTAVTTIDRVLIRKAASKAAGYFTRLERAGTVVKLTGKTANAEGFFWREGTASGATGWIIADYLRVLTKTEEAQLGNTGDPSLPKEATYRILRRGDTGEDVTRLQTELSRLGFLAAGEITGVYTTATIEAVKAYQRISALTVDGVAGPLTQHKLYGTVPVGTNNPGGTVSPNMYPVEKELWTVVNTVWQRGVTAVLTDVQTRLSYRAKRWAGGSHADVEPLTAADTVIMCRIYGVKNSQEIAEKDLWQRKPFWVTVNGHTYAASIYGVPHNYPAGDTIPNNDFNGQFCVHFVGSTTHTNPNVVDPNHAKAIQEAYDKATVKK